MNKKISALILMAFMLVGCNLTRTPGDGMVSTPVGDVQESTSSGQPTVESTSGIGEIVPIPASSVQLEGIPYQAYQLPGDPFRIVCQEPCQLDQQYIYAEYAGFSLGHAALIELTGIDTLAELQPVDMHLELNNSICSELPVGHAGVYIDVHQAYTCSEGPGYYPTLEEKIRMAARIDGQYFPLHEYMHTIFFGRISGKAGDFQDYHATFFHDYVVPLPSFAVGILDPAGFCSTGAFGPPPGDYGGSLILGLCQQNGFQLADLALSLEALDALVQSGGGLDVQEGYGHPVPLVAQYRDLLNQLLGSDTTDAFAQACWPSELFGDGYSLPASCSTTTTSGTPTPLR